ncbi:synaptosomal-associated protein [Salpingoeca rosetta]|uniref:Synaptosomal-associated protein n=1 Tax=Salpingoeca rosetta (strain ATCC 50818 / BSB-021) TaxID=946362 RepID=F2ULN7_SALR5|nr:synaptosomal-associated protein [Salpingoeca rosetta]EGD78036.1 synaptosomal-associated protein [Salpingoeca rosetta]|eukprot:XP_004990098.1 synaptosomal-associated protein [Salpingoeca rosetta]
MARAEDGSEALTTGRINLMFAALAKLIPHTGHLKHEESMSMLKTVARELTMTAADMSRAKEKAQQFADRDTEAFEVVGQFYPQLKEPHLPATRPASLAVEQRPEHVDGDDHKLLWRQLGTRRQFESLPPTLLSIEVVYAYITDLAGRVLAHDVQLAFGTATSEDDVISFQQHMYNMFDDRFPHADAATLAIRDFLFSVEHHSSADPLVQLLFFSLVGKQDVSSLMHYTIVHMLIHTLQLSTPQHLSWLMTELFPDSHLSLDKLMLAYTGFADGAPSSDRLSRFYLRETAARDWNPAAAEIVRVAAEVAGAPPTGSKPLSVIKCERIKHALHPHVPDQVLRLLYEQSAKIHGVDAELPSSVCTWLLLHARLLFETEMVRLSLKDRLDVEATRRMRNLVHQDVDTANRTLQMLDEQGHQLNRVEENLDGINANTKRAEKELTKMEKCCGIFYCPCTKRQSFDENARYNRAFRQGANGNAAQDGSGSDSVISTQPKSERGAARGGGRAEGGSEGRYVERILENDAREDEMDDNMRSVAFLRTTANSGRSAVQGRL